MHPVGGDALSQGRLAAAGAGVTIRACRGDERQLVGVTVGAGRGSGGMTGRWLEEIGAGQWGDTRSLCFMVDAGGVRFWHVLCVLSESLLDAWVGVAGGVILW